MAIKDYLKLDWKKPEDTDELIKIRARKDELKTNLEECYSRLETIELCSSNAKYIDGILLSKYLLVDIINLILSFFHQNKISNFEEIKPAIEKIPDSELVSIINEELPKINTNSVTEDNLENLISFLGDSINRIEKEISKKYSLELIDPLAIYKKRIFLQSAILIFIVVAGLISGTKKYNDMRPLNADNAILFFGESKEMPINEANAIALPFEPSPSWQTLTFNFPTPQNVEVIRLDPIHQEKARIQLKEMKYYNSKGEMVFQRDFTISQDNVPKIMKCCVSNDALVPGRVEIGQFFELISVAKNGNLFLKTDLLTDVAKVEFTIRYAKKSHKFKN
jgi:hypothetical protein